ncbi:MAG: hypothetical protein MZV64_74180 [Ignavibacteriales bacterium]|nr:hypothetical protein [Ignavibacteriales bacterium]
MQMAKTSAKLAALADAGIPYISILTDPTTGGVTASFCHARGREHRRAGRPDRVRRAARHQADHRARTCLPGSSGAEFLLEHGFLDMVVHRREMKTTVATLLSHFSPDPALRAAW